jgi:hypothetical protein
MPTVTEFVIGFILKNSAMVGTMKGCALITKDAPMERYSLYAQLVHDQLGQYISTVDKGVSPLHTFIDASLALVEWERVELVLNNAGIHAAAANQERRCR